jgi:chitinase
MRSLLLCPLLAATLFPALCAAAPAPPQKPLVVGYVFAQDAQLQPGQIDPQSITRANYAFANVKDGRMVTGFAHDAENYAYLVALKKQNPEFTVLVSVGGWLWSDKFSDVALTAQSRAVFEDSVMEFLARYDLDGLDIDWEYPGLPGASQNFRPQDGHNFTLLLADLRARFDRQEKKIHRRLYLTIAAGSGDDYIAHTELKQDERYLDTVNLMAYDYVEPGSDPLTGNHAPLLPDPADTRNFSADQSVRNFEKAGVPAEKLLLGVPFYGHVWGQVADVNHGYLQPGKAIPNAYSNFSAVNSTMLNQGFVRYWDSAASVPYLYNSDKHIFVSYEDTESLAAKCRYVSEHKLGGVMFWDYSGDPTGTLLKAINQSFHQAAASAGGSQR